MPKPDEEARLGSRSPRCLRRSRTRTCDVVREPADRDILGYSQQDTSRPQLWENILHPDDPTKRWQRTAGTGRPGGPRSSSSTDRRPGRRRRFRPARSSTDALGVPSQPGSHAGHHRRSGRGADSFLAITTAKRAPQPHDFRRAFFFFRSSGPPRSGISRVVVLTAGPRHVKRGQRHIGTRPANSFSAIRAATQRRDPGDDLVERPRWGRVPAPPLRPDGARRPGHHSVSSQPVGRHSGQEALRTQFTIGTPSLRHRENRHQSFPDDARDSPTCSSTRRQRGSGRSAPVRGLRRMRRTTPIDRQAAMSNAAATCRRAGAVDAPLQPLITSRAGDDRSGSTDPLAKPKGVCASGRFHHLAEEMGLSRDAPGMIERSAGKTGCGESRVSRWISRQSLATTTVARRDRRPHREAVAVREDPPVRRDTESRRYQPRPHARHPARVHLVGSARDRRLRDRLSSLAGSVMPSKSEDRTSFVESSTRRPNASMVSAMVALASNLGMTPLAEGIETEAEWRALVERGCERGQGFFFSRPVPADQIVAIHRRASLHVVEGGAAG